MQIDSMYIKKIHIFLLLFCMIQKSENSFKSRMKGVKSKAKDYFKSQFGKKGLNFMGLESSAYPGTNPEYRKINNEKWQMYYDCLEMQKKSIGMKQSIAPEAMAAVVGGYIRLNCRICLSPSNMVNLESVEWSFGEQNSDSLETVEFTENIFISPADKALEIYNLQPEHTGQYLCTLGFSSTAPYFVTVLSNTENMAQVHSKYALNAPYPKPPEVIPEYNLVLATEWGPWSGCNKCRKIGRRYKLGFCYITMEQSTNKTIIEGNSKKRSIEKISDKDLELITIFQNGLPCDSHILPESVQNIPQIKNRRNEIMLGYCKEICKDEEIFEVKDKMGNVIEKANNSAGIYSLAQGLPPIEPAVERRLQYAEAETEVVLNCPGNLNSKAPIDWQLGSKNLVPRVIAKESNNRIYISLTDRIHIKKAKKSDSNIYSCWQHTELAGTIRLVVEEQLKMNFNHHIMLMGVIVILSTFLYVFFKAFLGRKYTKAA